MKYVLLILLSFSLVRCAVDDAQLEDNTWKVTRFTNADGETTRNKITCLSTFNDGALTLNLDANQCGLGYSLEANGSIVYDGTGGCTLICCDEPNSLEAVQMISVCTHYTITGQTLMMSNDEGVEVKLVVE